jgi:hypothetical protein
MRRAGEADPADVILLLVFETRRGGLGKGKPFLELGDFAIRFPAVRRHRELATQPRYLGPEEI